MSNQLKAKVAEIIMRLKPEVYDESERLYLYDNIGCPYEIPEYPTDINIAMTVLDRIMKDNGYLVWAIDCDIRGTYEVSIQCVKTGDKWEHRGESLSEAICVTALMSRGYEWE